MKYTTLCTMSTLLLALGCHLSRMASQDSLLRGDDQDGAGRSFLADIVGILGQSPTFRLIGEPSDVRFIKTNQTLTVSLHNDALLTSPQAGGLIRASEVASVKMAWANLLTFPMNGVPDLPYDPTSEESARTLLESVVSRAIRNNPNATAVGNLTDFRDYHILVDECARHSFSPQANISLRLLSDSEFETQFNCSLLTPNGDARLTLSLLEFQGINAYTSGHFRSLNRFLRSRRFQMPTFQNARVSANGLDVAQAFIMMAMISGINKLPVDDQREYYRGSQGLFGSCHRRSDGGLLTPPGDEADTHAQSFRKVCDYFASDRIYQDCGVISTSKSPGIALTYAVQADIMNDEFDNVQRPSDIIFTDLPLPTHHQRLPTVFVIRGDGRKIEAMSQFPYEQEVVFRPSTKFEVIRDGIQLALRRPGTRPHSDFMRDYSIKTCDDTLSPEEMRRISHLRIVLEE